MDLTRLAPRILEITHDNVIVTFEKGHAVRRAFATVQADVAAAGQRLRAWGVKPGLRVGIRSPNCYEWVVYDLALIELRAPTVAFTEEFAALSPEELCRKYQLSLFLAGPDEQTRGETSEFVAYLGGVNAHVHVIPGKPEADDLEFDRPGFIFSSGSAGGLKGLVLNRKGIEACVDAFTQAVRPLRDDRLLLFLPMSNFQQRLMYYSAFWYGFDLIVTQPAHLFRALQELAPTILIAPPALYEAFETRFENMPPSKRLLARTLGGLVQRLPIGAVRQSFGRAIFRQAHAALGGRMRFMVTGMAPIKRSTLDLFSLMQLPLYETYGLIESGSVSLNLPGACRLGSVGRLLPGVSVSFRADGEILVQREHAIACGYFECAEGESERTFFGKSVATGDIGRLDDDGYLHLIGRKKEIIITGGGDKVHPEAIEAEINSCPDVARAVVFAMPGAAGLAALVLPKRPEDAAVRARIEHFVEDLNDHRRKVSVDRVVFTDVVFTRENGFLRPNLKLDRRQIGEHFRAEIDVTASARVAAGGGGRG